MVYPFENSKFVIAVTYSFEASDRNCLLESTLLNLYQYTVITNESGGYDKHWEYYDLEYCNNNHFTDKEFEEYPILHNMICISSNLSLVGSSLSK